MDLSALSDKQLNNLLYKFLIQPLTRTEKESILITFLRSQFYPEALLVPCCTENEQTYACPRR